MSLREVEREEHYRQIGNNVNMYLVFLGMQQRKSNYYSVMG